MKNRVTLLNMISGLLLQVVALISGLIIPRIILKHFGSEINGVIASIEQFLSFISLAEGGLTGVLMAKLYHPLVYGENRELSTVLVTGRSFYRKVGLYFIIYSIGLAIVFPLIRKEAIPAYGVALLVLILSINLLVQYVFSITLRTLLIADKKGYIVSFSQIAISIANIVFAIAIVRIYPQVHLLKFVSGCLYIIQPVLFSRYVKKHYSIDWSQPVNNELVKSRWNGFAINLAAFIHNSTDTAVLTLFTDFKIGSVYSVYNMVCGGIKSIIQSAMSGISQSIGQSYAKGDYSLVHFKLDLYEYIVFALVFFLFSVASLMITPFVMLYTAGVNDNNYYQPLFGCLLIASEVLYLVKIPHLDLSYAADRFKDISVPAYIEAGLNILVSIICVFRFGLCGVVAGTIIGMAYRLVFHVYYTSKILPGRKQWIFYRKLLLFVFTAFLGILVCCKAYPFTSLSLIQWILHGFVYSLIIGGMLALLTVFAFKKELLFFLAYLKAKHK